MQNLSKVLRLDFKKIIIKEQACGKVFRIKFFWQISNIVTLQVAMWTTHEEGLIAQQRLKQSWKCPITEFWTLIKQISAHCDTSVKSIKNKVIAHTKQIHRKEMLCSAVLMNMKSIWRGRWIRAHGVVEEGAMFRAPWLTIAQRFLCRQSLAS